MILLSARMEEVFGYLDNITPLRQLNNQFVKSSAILYKPQNTYRVRWTMYTDTPVPQEEPAGENPPDGVIIDYYLSKNAQTISLEIIGPYTEIKASFYWGKRFIRKYSNTDTMYKIGEVNIPHYWIRPQQILSSEPGHHRLLWDMKYTPLNLPVSYPISATYMNTEPNPTAPWVMPGDYVAILTADGVSDTTLFTIKMDPRIKTPFASLQQQHDLSLQCYNGRKECVKNLEDIRLYRSQLKNQLTTLSPTTINALNKKDTLARELETTPQGSTDWSFGRLNSSFASVFNILQDSDMPPTTQMINAVKELNQQMIILKKKWEALKK